MFSSTSLFPADETALWEARRAALRINATRRVVVVLLPPFSRNRQPCVRACVCARASEREEGRARREMRALDALFRAQSVCNLRGHFVFHFYRRHKKSPSSCSSLSFLSLNKRKRKKERERGSGATTYEEGHAHAGRFGAIATRAVVGGSRLGRRVEQKGRRRRRP